MKKFLIIGVIVALVLIVVGGAGVAYAHFRGVGNNAVITVNTNRSNIVRQFEYGPGGMMGGYGYGYGPGGMMGGYGPGGMMGERGNAYRPGMMGGRGVGIARGAGIMHDYMIAAFAKAVNLTVEQVDTRLADGQTFKEIAIAQGITEDKLPELATQVRKAALDQAVADGVITQTQADRMLERMNNNAGKGFGFDCPMWDGDETQQP